jgi:hypothetical protein
VRLITNSEIKALFMCPKNHEFGYVRGLTPKRRRIALDEGTASHEALQVFYAGGTIEAAVGAFDKVYDEHVARLDPYPHEREKAIQKFLATRALLTVYLETVAQEDMKAYNTEHVEEEFCVPILDKEGKPLPDVMFAGKLDGIWTEKTANKTSMVVEHKFYSSFSESENTMYLDQQVTLYALAAALAFGIKVPLTLYNVCVKPRNEMTKNETPDDFYYRIYDLVKGKDKKTYFHRMPVTRGPQHFRVAHEILYNAALIITGKKPMPYVYRNVGDHCLWLCSFKPPCLEENERMMSELYEQKSKPHPELEIKED